MLGVQNVFVALALHGMKGFAQRAQTCLLFRLCSGLVPWQMHRSLMAHPAAGDCAGHG